ncbi:hypothetical protein E4U28_002696 [Claviceps purpurea]|nr:hypothetical protein E4U28_002696 [Claviceps purpurea]
MARGDRGKDVNFWIQSHRVRVHRVPSSACDVSRIHSRVCIAYHRDANSRTRLSGSEGTFACGSMPEQSDNPKVLLIIAVYSHILALDDEPTMLPSVLPQATHLSFTIHEPEMPGK